MRGGIRPGSWGAAVAVLVLGACSTNAGPSVPTDLVDVTGSHDVLDTDDPSAPPAPGGDDSSDDDSSGDDNPGSKDSAGSQDRSGGVPPGPATPGVSVHDDAGSTLVDASDPTVDHAELDAVVNGLLQQRSAVLRDLLQRGAGAPLTADDARALRAVLGGQRLIETTQAFQRYAHDNDQRNQLLPVSQLGRPTWATDRVVHAEPACVVVIGSYDLSAVAVTPFDADERTVITLARMSDEQRAELGGHNPSGWRIEEVVRLITPDTAEPIPRPQWEGLDFAGSMALDACRDFEAFT